MVRCILSVVVALLLTACAIGSNPRDTPCRQAGERVIGWDIDPNEVRSLLVHPDAPVRRLAWAGLRYDIRISGRVDWLWDDGVCAFATWDERDGSLRDFRAAAACTEVWALRLLTDDDLTWAMGRERTEILPAVRLAWGPEWRKRLVSSAERIRGIEGPLFRLVEDDLLLTITLCRRLAWGPREAQRLARLALTWWPPQPLHGILQRLAESGDIVEAQAEALAIPWDTPRMDDWAWDVIGLLRDWDPRR